MKLVSIGKFLIVGPLVLLAERIGGIALGYVNSDEWMPWYGVLGALGCWHFGAMCLVVGRLHTADERQPGASAARGPGKAGRYSEERFKKM